MEESNTTTTTSPPEDVPIEVSTTATTENSSGTSKRSREEEDDDSGPSTKILKSSDDSDTPSEGEQQAIAAAKAEIAKSKEIKEKDVEEEAITQPIPAAVSTVTTDGTNTPQEQDAPPQEQDAPPQEATTKEDPQDPITEESSTVKETNVEKESSAPEPATPAPQPDATPAPVAQEPTDAVPQEQQTEQPSQASESYAQPPIVSQENSYAQPDAAAEAAPQETAPPPEEQQQPPPQQQDYVEESGQIAAAYVGRVIGKGGEMIRDLQARSGAKMDVDSNVAPGQPRIITYAGTRAQVDFAQQLVNMLYQNVPEENLPLGHAQQEAVVIPAAGVGKVIGRGGEMIRELQARSQAKIQIDHSGTSGVPSHSKSVTITGTEEAVTKAKEMVLFLVNNPLMEAQQSLNMLIEEKRNNVSAWGSGPPYPSMPNQGMNMQPTQPQQQPTMGDPYGGLPPGAGMPYGGGYAQPQYAQQQPQQQQQPRSDGSETMYASKQYMGRIIGSKGVTINDLQQRSGTHIQINQEISGSESEISITGPPAGIQAAKRMIQEILQAGPNHPYAGGGGSGGASGGGGYGSGGGYPPQGGGYHGSSGYGGGGGYHGASMMPAGYGGGYPPQQQAQQQQQAYGGYDPQAMAYGSYGMDPYGSAGGSAVGYGGASGGGYGGGGATYGGGAPAAASGYGAYGGGGAYGTTGSAGGGYGGGSYGGAPYGAGGGGAAQYGMPPAAAAAAPPQSSPWKMATSPDGQVYYYNEQTGQTQWEKPHGMQNGGTSCYPLMKEEIQQ